MRNVTLEELLEAGCHFGHQVTRQNPKARDYIFEARDNINIIDLEKTKEGLDEAQAYVKKIASEGKIMVILGTKRQAGSLVKDEIARAKKEGVDGLYVVTNRWIGGILTNFAEISKNFKRIKQLDDIFVSSTERAKYTKKELLLFEREKQKLESFYGGIASLDRLPDALFVIDTHLENLAVREAIAMNVPVVGITDTNADPTVINYAIPANDDAVGSIKLITSAMVDAWIEGRKNAKNAKEEQLTKDTKEQVTNDTKQEKSTKSEEKIKEIETLKKSTSRKTRKTATDEERAEESK